jgi:hypothetical protein
LGESALPALIAMIGMVGKNQHHTLPNELFKKWNYPLPRGIVDRTIVKMQRAALPPLIDKLHDISDAFVMAECVDAIGCISYYSGVPQALDALKTACET